LGSSLVFPGVFGGLGPGDCGKYSQESADNRQYHTALVDLIRPARSVVVPVLRVALVDDGESELRRNSAAELLRNMFADRPGELATTFLDARVQDIRKVLPILDENKAEIEEFPECCNVRTWDLPGCRDVWQAIHQLLPRLRTPILAILDPATVAQPRRLAWGVSQLERFGAEFYTSPVEVNGRLLSSVKPSGLMFERSIRPETLIRLSGGELFGGSMLLFGDEAIQQEMASTTEPGTSPGEIRRFRHSRIPSTRDTSCFLQNPTRVVRTDTFQSLGG
jgi:hypothetical protein